LFGLSVTGMGRIAKAANEWRKTGNGMIATPFAEGAGFIKSEPAWNGRIYSCTS
jgi:hypothetical protein